MKVVFNLIVLLFVGFSAFYMEDSALQWFLFGGQFVNTIYSFTTLKLFKNDTERI